MITQEGTTGGLQSNPAHSTSSFELRPGFSGPYPYWCLISTKTCLGLNTSAGLFLQEKCFFLIVSFNFPCFSMCQVPLTLPPITHCCEEPGCISLIPWTDDMEAISPPSWSWFHSLSCVLGARHHFPPVSPLYQGLKREAIPRWLLADWTEEMVLILPWLSGLYLSHTAPGAADPYFAVWFLSSSAICPHHLPVSSWGVFTYIHTYYFL